MAELRKRLVDAEGYVTTALLNDFTYKHCGLYEAFQAAVDPGTIVYCAGTVSDNGGEGARQLPSIMEPLLGLKVVQVCCGGQHAAVLTAEGHIMTWGRGRFGRLGHGDHQNCDAPTLVERLRDIKCVKIACGFAYTAVVTQHGHLYTWGAGENGRLGLGDAVDRIVPHLVEALQDVRVVGVYAGSVHTCALTDTGDLYSFGKHEYTGHGFPTDLLSPCLLRAFGGSAVRQVSVGPGGYHTIALTTKGEVYTWGHNRVGQLGFQNDKAVHQRNFEGAYYQPHPAKVSELEGLNVMVVVAGWGHTAVLTATGQVYVCGRNYQGQLGLGDPSQFPKNERDHPYQPTFTQVSTLSHKRVIQVACGGEHSVFLCDDGEVYSVGMGAKGQLGHGNTTNLHVPQLLRHLKMTRREIFQIACGNNCTLILAGNFQPLSLQELCAETIQKSDDLMRRLARSQSCLPPRLFEHIRMRAAGEA
jgi:alpha-tubulin suppressor-like RCC1 family protein